MKMTEKIDKLMAEKDINNHYELSRISGVPYTTIKGLYEKGYSNAKLPTLLSLARTLGCTLDYLADDSVEINTKKSTAIESGSRQSDSKEKVLDSIMQKIAQLAQQNPERLSALDQMIDLTSKLGNSRKE